MKKIIVMSDTHGDTYYAEKVLKKCKDIDIVLHLGDYFRDAQKLQELFPNMHFEYIYGNSDFMIGDVPAEKVIIIGGKKILMTHGHRYSVKWGYEKLEAKAKDEQIDILLFGHTHMSTIIKKSSFILLNPGSITDPRGEDDESYALITINEGIIETKILNAV